MSWADKDRDRSRRPINQTEIPHLIVLGTSVRAAREKAHLSRRATAAGAQIRERSLERIELGSRRTRRSTLTRIASVIVLAEPNLGPIDLLAAHWVGLAGPALAPESPHADRIARRRERRIPKRSE